MRGRHKTPLRRIPLEAGAAQPSTPEAIPGMTPEARYGKRVSMPEKEGMCSERHQRHQTDSQAISKSDR